MVLRRPLLLGFFWRQTSKSHSYFCSLYLLLDVWHCFVGRVKSKWETVTFWLLPFSMPFLPQTVIFFFPQNYLNLFIDFLEDYSVNLFCYSVVHEFIIIEILWYYLSKFKVNIYCSIQWQFWLLLCSCLSYVLVFITYVNVCWTLNVAMW